MKIRLLVLCFTVATSTVYTQDKLDKLKQSYRQSDDAQDSLKAIMQINSAYNSSTYLDDDSLRYYSHLGFDLAERLESYDTLGLLYMFYSVSHYYSDTTVFFEYMRKTADLSEVNKNYGMAMRACLNQMIRYDNFSQYDRLLSVGNQALVYIDANVKIGNVEKIDDRTACRIFKKMANTELLKGHTEKALSWTRRLKDYAYEREVRVGKIETYDTYINIYTQIIENGRIGQLEKQENVDSLLYGALDSMYQLSLPQDIPFVHSRYGYANTNFGQYYLRKHDYNKAKKYFKEAYETGKKLKHNRIQTNALCGLFDVCMQSDVTTPCIEYLQSLRQILKRTKTETWRADLLVRELRYYERLGSYKKADGVYEALKNLLSNYPNKGEFTSSFETLAKYAEHRGKASEALTYYKKITTLRDSMKTMALTQSLEDLQVKYDVATTKAKYAELKQKQAQDRLKNGKILVSIILISLLLLISAAFSILKNRNKRLKSEKLQENFKQRMLRSHMSPHFTFNVLGTIQGYIHERKLHKAEEYLGAFAKLIRKNLEFTNLKLITLQEEIAFIEDYLRLEKGRKDGLFDYAIDVNRKDLMDRQIQPLFVQPIVENAIKHGFRNIESGGKLDVFFDIGNDHRVVITISDNGCGFAESKVSSHTSYGLNLIKERMESLNKEKELYHLTIDTSSDGSTITITLPYE